MRSPLVSIIVLNYNGRADTLACLRSLEQIRYPRAQVIVVDNGSGDGSVAAVRAAFPVVHLIETGANLGFAAGNNVGIRAALEQGADYVLLLNNDTEVMPDFLDHLVAVAETDSTIGIVGPTICFHTRPDLVWSAGGTIDRVRGVSQMCGLGVSRADLPADPREVDFVTGCALLCRRAVIEHVGVLDERFFMYYEETEWCARATRAGFRIVHVPQSLLYHKIPLDARADKPYVTYYMTRNRLLFLQCTHAPVATWANALFLQDLRTCLSWSIRPRWRGQLPQRDALLRGWYDLGRRRFGKMV